MLNSPRSPGEALQGVSGALPMVPYRGRGSGTQERLTPRLSVHCSLEATQTVQSKETEKILNIININSVSED